MPNTFTDLEKNLANWLLQLVEILRSAGGTLWQDLVQTVTEKSAVIQLDESRVHLLADQGLDLRIQIKSVKKNVSISFSSDAQTIRDIINGRIILDKAIADGRIFVKGKSQDLRKVFHLVMRILAESAINPKLRNLWREFDTTWPVQSPPPPCTPLDNQIPVYGRLIQSVPENVLRIQLLQDGIIN